MEEATVGAVGGHCGVKRKRRDREARCAASRSLTSETRERTFSSEWPETPPSEREGGKWGVSRSCGLTYGLYCFEFEMV